MKPSPSDNIQVQDHFSGEKFDLSIDENSLEHIMHSLTNLYSDAVLAVLREYPSNAWDSHIEAGQSRPIEVTLPTHLVPTFVIRDFGVGMSPTQVSKVYSKYGYSTKRHTDAQVGMLGLGCKSALAYTSQFTLTAIKDGVKTSALISRNDEGGGQGRIADTVATEEPNGVEVKIAVDNIEEFNRKARWFFSFWRSGVLVNGQEPETLAGTWIDEDVLLTEHDTSAPVDFGRFSNIVVMGNVPYPIDSTYDIFGYSSQTRVVAYVPIGAVKPTPPRESLDYNKRTKETIAAIRGFVRDRAIAHFQEQIDAVENSREVIKTLEELSPPGSIRDHLKWRGRRIPRQFIVNRGFIYDGVRGRTNKVEYRHNIRFDTLIRNQYLVVTDFGLRNTHPSHFAKLSRLAEERGISYRSVIFTPNKRVDSDWIELPSVSYEDVKAIKLPRLARKTSPRDKATYAVFHPIHTFIGGLPQKEIPNDAPVVYTTSYGRYPNNFKHVFEALGTLYIVAITDRQVDKFKRLYPEAQLLTDYVKDRAKELTGSFTEAEIYVATYGGIRSSLSDVKAGEIDDPEVSKLLEDLEDVDFGKIERWRKINSTWRYLYEPDFNKTANEFNDRHQDALDRYPLLEASRFHIASEHVIEYINAVYAKRNEKDN